MIPVAIPDLGGNEEKYVLEALSSTWISSTGAFLDRFEQEFAPLCDSRFGLAVCNGTAALHLAMLTLDVGPGDEVLVPSLTYVATANAVRYVGATPVFVDVEPSTWCIDPSLIESAITPRTKGIIAVHLYGHPADVDRINQIAAANDLWVVEDAAEAPLAEYKGRRVGSLSSIATFSFFGNKVLTSGEGGAVTLSDETLLQKARTIRGQGVDPHRRYYFPVIGHNFRLTNIAAAILCAQIERAETILAQRQAVFDRYESLLANAPGIGFQPVAAWAKRSPWLFCLTVDADTYGHTRDELAAHLLENGVDTRPFFYPLHKLPPYEAKGANKVDLPNTDLLAGSGMNLPTYASLEPAQIEKICTLIRDFSR
ncbi:DegT/DnrJ/EryC1/StrS family aminotransferase [Microbulbifer sp. S227A]|uniref:DegT/DnrJ/EryC1/StrS family aminotransferase n=1 Tax=Microbulbifer sp. S227A TaxID=3415131 RepID=UPI003C7CEB3B